MKRLSGYDLTGLFFGLWGFTNTTVTVVRYGWDQGMYLWFCNVGLFAAAWGLLRRDRALLLAFLGVAAFTHPLYVADSLWHLVTGANLFGVAEFMYQPGMPLSEFLLSRYHYFLIPAMAYAIVRFPRPAKDRTYVYIAVFQVLIFGLSYFVFPAAQNLNCIHESCFGSWLPYRGYYYAAGFFLAVAAGNVVCAKLLDRLLTRLSAVDDRLIRNVLCGCLAVGALLAGLDVWYKKRLPKLECAPAFEDSAVRVECLYTLEYDEKLLELSYRILNKLDVSQFCDTRADLYGEYENLQEGLYLKPHEDMRLKVLLSYPEKDVTLRMAASCLRMK